MPAAECQPRHHDQSFFARHCPQNDAHDEDDRKNRVVIHTLRHTFASHLAINGTPIFTIQKLMNHKDIKMTMRYAKLSHDSGREAIVNLGL